MANRNFNRRQALEKEVKDIYATITIGALGAPTLTLGVGVTSVSRTSQGLYRIVLDDKYTSLKSVKVIHEVSTAEDLTFQVKAEDVAGSTKSVDVLSLTSGVATDPSDGAILHVKIELKNSSAI